MIRKLATGLLSKVLGKKAGAIGGVIADEIVTNAADAATGGKASKIEAKVKMAKKANDILEL